MKMTVKGFIQAHQYSWDLKPTFECYPCQLEKHVQVCEVDIEFDLPDNFSMQSGQLEILKVEKEKMIVRHNVDIKEIEDRMAKLQCLEMTP